MKRYRLHSWIAIGAVLAAATTLRAGEIPGYPPTADDVEIHYVLSDIAGQPGDTDLPMYFSMVSNSPMQGFTVAFTYDRHILTAESFESLVAMDGRPPDFVDIGMWTPSDPDIPRHGCYLGIVIDMYMVTPYYPTEGEPLACVRFSIAADAAPETETVVTFEDNVVRNHRGVPLDSYIVVQGVGVLPDFGDANVAVTRFLNGKVKIMDEVSIFLRGDANSDHAVDLADAVFILDHLFGAGPAPVVMDSADANDDGRVNIADPIYILSFLFGGGPPPPAPFPKPGTHPRMDSP